MLDTFLADNDMDKDGNPAGGFVSGVGLSITWQNGPLGRGPDRKPPNGAFVETVIEAVRQRIHFYQTVFHGRFACKENEDALIYLHRALECLEKRTASREARGVEGTHNV